MAPNIPAPARKERLDASLAIATAAVTFLLVIVGGLVWSTGSALACPDWPLCYGQFFPKMEGQVLFEHGHRLIAATAATLTVVLAIRVFADRRLRALACLAVGLVFTQAALGALTVLLKLPLLIRVLHLATSQAFFATLLLLCVRCFQVSAAAGSGERALPVAPVGRAAGRALAIAALAVYAQLLIGALVRHTGSGMACQSVLLCAGSAWPSFGPGQIQMLHRYGALVTAGLVIWGTVRALPELKLANSRWPRRLAIAAHVLLLLQISLGIGSVQSFLAIPVVTLHLAVGALLWGDLAVLWAFTGAPRAEPLSAPAMAGLVPARTERS